MEQESGSPGVLRVQWIFDPSLPFFVDHFPGNPIVPAFHQLSRVIDAASSWLGVIPTRMKMRGVKFLRPIEPGNVVEFTFTPSSASTGGSFSILHEGELVTQGDLVAL